MYYYSSDGESFLKQTPTLHCYIAVAGAITNLDSLLIEMEAFNEDNKETVKENSVSDSLENQLDDLTEKLKAALENGEELNESLGHCSQCSKEIFENSLLVGDKTYHKECFTCHNAVKGKHDTMKISYGRRRRRRCCIGKV